MILGAIVVTILITGLLEAGKLRLPVGSSVLGNGTWVNVSELRAGDIIQTADDRIVRIKTITDIETDPLRCHGFITNATDMDYVVDSGIVVSGHGSSSQSTATGCGWLCGFLRYFHLSKA